MKNMTLGIAIKELDEFFDLAMSSSIPSKEERLEYGNLVISFERQVCEDLGLDWSERVLCSYDPEIELSSEAEALFERIKELQNKIAPSNFW